MSAVLADFYFSVTFILDFKSAGSSEITIY